MNEPIDQDENEEDSEVPLDWLDGLSPDKIQRLVVDVRILMERGGLSISPLATGYILEISHYHAEIIADKGGYDITDLLNAARLFTAVTENYRERDEDPSKSFGQKYAPKISSVIEAMKKHDLLPPLLFRVSRGQSLRDIRITKMRFAPRKTGIESDFYRIELIYRTVKGKLSSVSFELDRGEVKTMINMLSDEIGF